MGSVGNNEAPSSLSAEKHGIQQIKSQGVDGSGRMGTIENLEYNWRKDAIDCYHLALRMIALRIGSRQFYTLPEMYWQESHGVIP